MKVLMICKNSSIKLAAVFLFLTFSQILGESRGISGIVIDSESNEQIPNVAIRILETDRRITSNDQGEFYLNDIEFGEYTFVLTHINYKENISKISIDGSTSKVIVFYLIPKLIELDAVIISDYKTFSKFDDMQEVSSVLKGKELQKQLGLTLASTLKNEAGLAMRSMGPAPSRPVIRGLGSSRVLISEDNIKTTDLSATSPDHAVTIDPFSVSRIEVLRGPRILLQTPTSMGGIVNVIKEDIPTILHDKLTGQLGMFAESVNEGYLGSLQLEVPLSKFAFKAQVSKRKTNDEDTPLGTLENSDSENLNYNFASSYIYNRGFVGASFSRFELDYGVPGGFVGAHPNGVDIQMYKNQINLKSKYDLESPKWEDISFNLSRVFYRHKEYESSGAVGSEFKIINYLGDLKFHHNNLSFFQHGTMGLSFEYRDFDIGGFVFTSPSKSLNLSAHIFEVYSLGSLTFEFGARYDFDRITPEEEDPDAKIGYVKERTFNNYSLSASILYQQSDHVYFGANISKSSRVPTIEELYSEGPHLAAYSYEVGNPSLSAEKGIGGELFIYHQFENLFFNFTLYGNDFTNYIIPRNSGELNYATFLPIYKTEGVEAILYGLENRIDWGICSCLAFSNTISLTRGEFKEGGNLPQIPPVKGLAELKYKSDYYNFGISGEWALKQDKVDEFEEPTAGYFVTNLFFQYSFIFNQNTGNLSLNIDNIFDQEYRNHLSRVKSILPEAGRNFRLSFKMYFHL